MGIQSPTKGLVNNPGIVLKPERLLTLLFQVEGAALSESWLVLEDRNEISGYQFRKEAFHFKELFYLQLFYLMFYLIIYLLLFRATSSDRSVPEPNHAELRRLQRTTDGRLNARWVGRKEIA